MSKYSGMAFNQLRSEAKAAGFEGVNPKRADLEAFLESREPAPEVGAITPPKSAKVSKPATEVVVDTNTSVVDPFAKRKYSSNGRTEVKTRRAAVLAATKDFLADSAESLTQSQIFRGVCEAAKIEMNNNSWNDVTEALKSMATTGLVVSNKEEKKRTKYSRVIS